MSSLLSQSWLDLPDGTRFDLKGTTFVGRAPENGLVLDHPLISRKHVLLQAQGDGEFWLVDLGSSNGSYLNERRVTQPVELKAGDVIRLSETCLTFGTRNIPSDDPTAADLLASTLLSVRQARCWMMIADIIDSTTMAQQVPAEEWPLITGAWFKNCREIIESHGGHMMKYLGDGFFCYWLERDCTPTDLQQTLAQLLPLQESASPPFRIALHLGDAVIGSVPTMQELNLHGSQVNFTFRLEKLAGNLRRAVMLSQDASEAIGIETQMIARAKVEGFEGSHSFFAPATT